MWQIYLQTIAFSLDSIIKLLRFSVVVYLCCCPCITLKFILLAIIKTWKQTLPKLCLCTYRVNIHHYDKWRKVPVEGWKYPEILLAASALLREIYGVKLNFGHWSHLTTFSYEGENLTLITEKDRKKTLRKS